MKKRFAAVPLVISALLLCACSFAANDSNKSYVINTSAKGKPYYHLSYVVSSENLVSVDSLTKKEFMSNGGQFEVLIKKDKFPVAAPACKSNIILRMPWTPPNNNLRKKYSLYKNIAAIYESQKGSMPIAVELNPYVKMQAGELSLTQCNVFFRHANHEYVPHTEALGSGQSDNQESE